MADRPRVTRLHLVPGDAGADEPERVAGIGDLTHGDGDPAGGGGQAELRLIGGGVESAPRSARLGEISCALAPDSVIGGAVDLAKISAPSSTPGRVARVASTGAHLGPPAGDGPGRRRAGRPGQRPGVVTPETARPGGDPGMADNAAGGGKIAGDRRDTDLGPGGDGGTDRRLGRLPDIDVGSGSADSRSGSASGRPRSRGGPKQIDPAADPVVAAKEICLDLLTTRARTKHELADALRRRGVPDAAAATTLERFDEVGLIDDVAFAGQWVRSRQRSRGLARRALAVELRRKGVDDEIAEEALAEVDDAAEEERARELVLRKLRTVPADTPDQRVSAARRLVGMLGRKGYAAGVAYRVVREALAGHGADLDEFGNDHDSES